jgi:hypothetical protein
MAAWRAGKWSKGHRAKQKVKVDVVLKVRCPKPIWRKGQHFQRDPIVSLAQHYQRGSFSMDEVIAPICDGRSQILDSSERVVRQFWSGSTRITLRPNTESQ